MGFLNQYGPHLCVAFLVVCSVGGYIRDKARGVRR
jgi:hypothetical protein